MSKKTAEKARKLYWDTYRSWFDKLEEKQSKTLLFQGPRAVSKTISNFNGYGMMPYDQSGEIVKAGAQVIASSGHISAIIRSNTVMSISVSDKEWFQMPLLLSLDGFDRGSSIEESIEVPNGLITMGDHPIEVPARVPLWVTLTFDPPAEQMIRRIETRVGPGSGWVEIVSYLLIDVERIVR